MKNPDQRQHCLPRARLRMRTAFATTIALSALLTTTAGAQSDSEGAFVLMVGADTFAVENFTLNFGGLDRLVADKLDFERFLIVRADMLAGADELTGPQQK